MFLHGFHLLTWFKILVSTAYREVSVVELDQNPALQPPYKVDNSFDGGAKKKKKKKEKGFTQR